MKGEKNAARSDGEIREMVAELVAYVRVIAASKASEKAQSLIDIHEKAKAYTLMDGKRTDTDIAKSIHVPRRTVTEWEGKFVASGLAVRVGRSQRALFTLEDLGINLRSLKKKYKKGKSEEPASEAVEEETVEE